MRYEWNRIGTLLVGVGIVVVAGGLAHAQTCAANQTLCQSGACCSAPGICCPSTIGGCCSEETPYCCGGGICAVTLSDCPNASSSEADGGCLGYDVPCGAGCIPAGAACCDATHYCPPTTVCASPSTTMCTDGTTSPPTNAYAVRSAGSAGSAGMPAISPLGDPPDATARSCSASDGPPASRLPMFAAVGLLALIQRRRRGTSRFGCAPP